MENGIIEAQRLASEDGFVLPENLTLPEESGTLATREWVSSNSNNENGINMRSIVITGKHLGDVEYDFTLTIITDLVFTDPLTFDEFKKLRWDESNAQQIILDKTERGGVYFLEEGDQTFLVPINKEYGYDDAWMLIVGTPSIVDESAPQGDYVTLNQFNNSLKTKSSLFKHNITIRGKRYIDEDRGFADEYLIKGYFLSTDKTLLTTEYVKEQALTDDAFSGGGWETEIVAYADCNGLGAGADTWSGIILRIANSVYYADLEDTCLMLFSNGYYQNPVAFIYDAEISDVLEG